MHRKTHIKIGIDEAGRGPWYGPVVASAVFFDPNTPPEKSFLDSLTDSKKLSERRRNAIFDQIIEMSYLENSSPKVGEAGRGVGEESNNTPPLTPPILGGEPNQEINLSSLLIREKNPALSFGVGVVDAQYIDEYGIKGANREAMRRALEELLRKIPKAYEIQGVLIDGNDHYTFPEFFERSPLSIIRGDEKVKEISTASIIAKVFRDELMKTYSILHPDLRVDQHKGYGTRLHQSRLTPESITSFHRLSFAPVQRALTQKPRLLLHVCCGPDATIPIVDLKSQYEIIAYWYDPNIQPRAEYEKRRDAFARVCEIEGIEWIEGEYDVKNFFEKIRGVEKTPERGEKCYRCYDMRLESSARLAREMSIPYYTSTLLTSPHKDLEWMYELGEKYAREMSVIAPLSRGVGGFDLEVVPMPSGSTRDSYGVNLDYTLTFLSLPFRKNNGFLRSVEYTTKHGIYRQNYCGCVYSDTFPGRVEKAKEGLKEKKWSG